MSTTLVTEARAMPTALVTGGNKGIGRATGILIGDGHAGELRGGCCDIVTGDVERLGGRPPKPRRDVLAGTLKSPSA